MKANGFRNAFLFIALAVPACFSALRADEVPVWRYTVKPGDNLISISERYFARADSWPKVQKANRISDPHRMLPGTVLRIPADLLRQSPAQAVLEDVYGEVRWRAGESDWQTAVRGQQLAAGMSLETHAQASALLLLADGSKLVVAANSLLTLDTLSLYAGGLMADTRMRLQRGQAEVMANPEQRSNQHLKIETPSAQAVVRGTHFRLAADQDATREETLGGLVGVSSAGKGVSVPVGRGTVAKPGEPPITPVPLLAAANLSALPARIEQLPLRFPLPRLAGATGWQAQIAPDRSFERLLLGKSTRSDSVSFADLPNGDYVLRLRAIDANGLQGLDALHAFTVFARPFPPGLNAPGDAATIREAKANFAWGQVVDIERYHVQVSTTPDFASPLYDETLALDQWQAPQELPPGRLYWRAASIGRDAQQGPWSTPAAFTYKPGPGAADLGRAALEIGSEKISLQLPKPPDGLVYEALLATDKSMSPVLSQAQSGDGVLELPRPDSGSYFLGVRLVDRSDNTPGPLAVQKIEIPHSRLWWLLLLLPLAL